MMQGEAPPLTKQPLPQDPTLYDLTEWTLITAIITEQGAKGAWKVGARE
jgi:methylthioribose-1-phosphate isomerase